MTSIINLLLGRVVIGAYWTLLWGYPICIPSAKNQKARRAPISVTLSQVPDVGPGENSFGTICGTVINAPRGSRVVIYSLGDTWYVQPFVNAPFTTIGRGGKYSATIHGGFEYVAYVCKPEFIPPATSSVLPKVGGNVLAMCHRKPNH